MSYRRLPSWIVSAALAATPLAAPAADITVYRCTDAQGRLALRDTPCAKGDRQETRELVRPKDPPPRPTPPPAPVAVATPPPAPPPQVIVLTTPRPMYECVTPDGERYTSETSEGNPRWVPYWTLGYPAVVYADGPQRPDISVNIGSRHGGVQIQSRPRASYYGYAYSGGTMVRDECHALPQAEVCDRLRDRRFALDRRYNSALQSERTLITQEQRGIDARLGNDCGGS